MTEDRFGNIRIDTGTPSDTTGADVSPSGEKGTGVPAPSAGLDIAESFPERERYSRQKRGPRYQFPKPSRRTVIWVSILPMLVIIYGVGSYFAIPLIIKGFLVPKLSSHIDRPVAVGRIVFSPFNLELFLDDVTVGPLQGDKAGNELLVSDTSRLKFSFARFLDGKLICKQVELDGISANVVRKQDSTVDLKKITSILLPPLTGQKSQYWPGWLILNEVMITAGQINIDDQLAKKVFNIEQIRFFLPSADTRERDHTAMPKLSAVVDSSPFEINAVRFQNQSGAWRTGFSFEFKKVVLNNFKELFPLPHTGLGLSEGEADIQLDIILPENQDGAEEIVVEGEAQLRNLKWQDQEALTQVTLPEGRIVYRYIPSSKLVHLANVEFHEPEFRMEGMRTSATREPFATFAYLYSLLEKTAQAKEMLHVESFLWNNGRIIISKSGPEKSRTILNDVIFRLRGITTAGYRSRDKTEVPPSGYDFRAKDISVKPPTEFVSAGKLDPGAVLSGKLDIIGLDLARYPSLLPRSDYSFTKGVANISVSYVFGGHRSEGNENLTGQKKLFNGSFEASGYTLSKQNKKTVSGETLSCRNFSASIESRTLFCDQLQLTKSDISADRIFSISKTKGKSAKTSWRYLADDLVVDGSTIRTRITGLKGAKKKTSLVFQNVNLSGKNLNSEKVADNVTASATIGKEGKVQVQGSYSTRTNSGNLKLDVQNLDVLSLKPYYATWFVPTVRKGLATASGRLQLPDKIFRGTVSIDELQAGKGGEAKLGWKKAVSNDVLFQLQPISLGIDELVLQEASLSPGLSSGDIPVSSYVRLQDRQLPQAVRLGKIRFENGKLDFPEPILYPGYQPELEQLNGTLAFVDGNNHQFNVEGRIKEAGHFNLLGAGSLSDINAYSIDVRDFPLRPFDSVLRKEAGFNGQRPVASWKQSKVSGENGVKVNTRFSVRNVIPDSAFSSAPALSMMVGADRSFSFDFEGVDAGGKQMPFLFEQFVTRLRHQEVKAAISLQHLLMSTLPGIDLPNRALFQEGSSVIENTVSWDGYKEVLKARPYVAIHLQGQFDPEKDHAILLAGLQAEADRKREEENKRRALEKVRILQEQKRREKTMQENKQGTVVEENLENEFRQDLDPLPRVIVQLDPSRLKELARERGRNLYKYLAEHHKIDPDRIVLEKEVVSGTASVQIRLIPFYPTPVKEQSE